MPQVIVSDDATVTALPGFEVDTSNNGNGLALQVSGNGLISFTGSPSLTGAGARFSVTGASGSSQGALNIASAGSIAANGAHGLRLDNDGNGDTMATWVGSIANSGGNGVFARNLGSGALNLLVNDVSGRDDGIRVQHGGSGVATITASGPVSGDIGSGVRIGTIGASGSIDLTVADVTGGAWGILLDNTGTGSSRITATGTVTGLSEDGIWATGGAGTLDIDISAAQVNGLVAGIRTENQGTGHTAIAATGPVTGEGYGIFAVHGASAQDISIAATDVAGFYGIRTFNEGTGSTLITATGTVTGADYGIIAQNVGGSTDLNIRAADVRADGNGIEAENSGSGTTNVVVGTVTGQGDFGIRITTAGAAGSVDLAVGDATGDTIGVVVANSGTGAARVIATGTVTGVADRGMTVVNSAGTTDIEIHANNVNGGSYAGLLALNDGTGDTLVETTGLVAALGIYGIAAVNEATSRNLSVHAFDVIGGRGLSISNFGTGATEVVSTGTVTGYSNDGVVAVNQLTATDLRVDVNVVNGDERGMRIINMGTGSTGIQARGSVTGATSTGIDAEIGAGAQGVTLDAVDVTGTSGIRIDNQGVGATHIAATGTVTGVSGDGINVFANTLAGEVAIDVATVTGSTGGVIVTNYGTGSASITASGSVSALAADGFGIAVASGTGSTDIRIAAADVLGNARGIHAENLGTGETSIASTGTVTGGNDFGIFARNDAGATDLTIAANTVLGAEDGIATEHVGTGITHIVAAAATGTTGAGVRVQAAGTAGAVDLTLGTATGGTYGALVTNYGTGSTRVETTGAVSGAADAGIAIENGAGATGIDLRAAQTSGENYGIQVENLGAGNTSVVATGPVTASAGMGMFVFNNATAANIRVEAAGVQGAETGMLVVNQGTGTTSISAGGLVTGTNVAGIDARAGVNAQGITVSAAAVTGASGIMVENFGQGSAGISATGTVTAQDATGTGIAVVNGTGATDLSVAAASVVGGVRGIDTVNSGSGDTLILANGLVSGSQTGIRAYNSAASGGLGIRTAAVQSAGTGIVAENHGTGRTIVRAEGAVTAQGEAGIGVIAGAGSGEVIVMATSVSGGLGGIWMDNAGVDTASITATGAVSGTNFGIMGRNGVAATDLTIHAVDAQGGSNAIVAENLGTGETLVVATGTVVGQAQSGIRVTTGAGAGDITVEAGNASGGLSGISVANLGLGDTTVTVNGVVQGGTRGVEAFADGNQRVAIFNNGTIRNASGLGASRAIGASGGLVGIANAATLLGTVEIAGDTSLMLNAGTWQSVDGVSSFSTLDDTLFNTTGTIIAGTAAGALETTTWQGLEHLRNGGVLRLQDGGTGDRMVTSAASTFLLGSTLAVDIGGATAADLFRTTGTLQIEPGSRLSVVATQPLVLGGKHVIVQADGGLTGQFAFEDQLLTAFAGLRDGYTATTAYIEFAQLKPLAGAGLTPNQKETGGGADSLPAGNALKDALILLPTDAAAQDAFDQLSGEIHPSARGAMFDDARLVRGAVLDRLADGSPGWSAWGRAFGATGQNDGDFNAARMHRDTRGGLIGVDHGFGAVTIGVAGGWTDTDLRIAARRSNGSVETVHAMAYAGAQLGPVQLRGGAGYAWTTTDTRRSIAFQGFSDQPSARYDGSVLQAYGEAGYRLPLGGGHVEPFANLTVVRARTDAFAESGGLAALTGKARSEERVASTLGLRLETSAAGPVSVRGSIGWNRAWGDIDPVGVHAFAGGTPFTILGAAGSRDSALARFEARMRLSPNVTLSVGYDGVLGKGGEDHAVTGGLRIVF